MKKSTLVRILVGVDLVFLTTLSYGQNDETELTMSVMSRDETPAGFVERLNIESLIEVDGVQQDLIVLDTSDALQLDLGEEMDETSYTGVRAYLDLVAFNGRELYPEDDAFEPVPVSNLLPEQVNGIVDETSPVFDDLLGNDGPLDDIGDGVDGVGDDLADLGDDLGDDVNDGLDDLGDGVDDVTGDVGDGINDAGDDINDTIGDTGDAVNDGLDDIDDGLDDLDDELGDGPLLGDVSDELSNPG